MKEVIAFCALHCHECDAYKTTQANDEEALERIAREWSTETMWFTAKDIRCGGCGAPKKAVFAWARDCPLRNCCVGKGFAHCTECPNFPCEIVEKSPGAKQRLLLWKKKR